ncbi:class I SAM-dependent methyltransferase [Aureibacter tunicatorum]|uniref:tRNA (Cmo5U34)-methyltransferase n=1 Tax=Aureibacter tunicatorum TaxID=866807 RepID=A0AAE4BRY7_9BACT|nr:class I SAM-dependent methyltransferase [Aureibacter tunicatorum]MDR6240669.1 tRNA (cmo5U34)-methyltransferase [Aureibacter tunicatorum]BDD06998.1 S-adenosylmethionine-dependent methyltransferase [Aureibacter tunicatorum]
MKKSTINEIRDRFDQDVERFSNLETGQTATIDASFTLDLVTEAAKCIAPNAKTVLDVGCGAGNFTLKLLEKISDLDCTMVDLSQPMLDRASKRLKEKTSSNVNVKQGDIRNVELEEGAFDIILAGAVLHHLRDEKDWELTFEKLFTLLSPNGCLLVSDLLIHDIPSLNDFVWEKYGEYLTSLNGEEYRDKVLAYIEKEDSPRSMSFQFELMKKIGFQKIEILHKNLCFGALAGIKNSKA